MKNFTKKILVFIILMFIFISTSLVYSQQENELEIKEIEKIFNHLESGIKTSSIKEFNNYLMAEIFISLENGVTSYFSSTQSYHILDNYFKHNKPIGFKLIEVVATSEKPFAVGQLKYSKNGILNDSQVFATLLKENGKWKISQIIINQ